MTYAPGMTTSPPFHDPEFWAGDPYPAFAELRAEDPVHRYEGPAGNLWALTRHADVLAAEKDPKTFSSFLAPRPHGMHLPMMISMDEPEHGKRRKLVSRGFTPRNAPLGH